MENIYCISGLGADERIFKKLKINNANLIFLPWAPFDKHDELPCYAQKMASLIPEKNPTLLGLSFGGMLTTEIANLMQVQKAFLVSSAKTRKELGEVSVTVKFLIQNNLIPFSLFKKPNKILYNQFGAETEEDKQLLGEIMRDTDPKFLSWAFKAILDWTNNKVPANLIHIHGTHDNIIRPAFVNPDYWINQGSHMMVYDKAADVSALIEKHLS
jgi:pimeloyl-ACP methyl ester carboxylesterase